MVYYRKYRPQSLSELIGQEQIVESLQKALAENRLSHAYLFTGQRGVGKTSTARILAKMVNCEEKNPPCNKCAACISISDGSSLDLIEIDAASNRGIDDIRDLRDKIKLSPSSLKKKVYIIDEVHALTPDAFNALLKTLEEPPEHVLFVLATTEAQKIPQTILSRVTRMDFNSGDGESLQKAILRVAEGEKMEIDEGALKLLVKRSEGSFRDGVKLLDQVSSGIGQGSSGKITQEMVEGLIKGGKSEAVLSLVESLSGKDPKNSLEVLASMVSGGVNLKELALGVMDTLRLLLLLGHGLEKTVEEEAGKEKVGELAALASKFDQAKLILILEYFQKALERMKTASIQSLPLEIAVIESTRRGEQTAAKTEPDMVQSKTTVASVQSYSKPEAVEVTVLDVAPRGGNGNSDLLILNDKWNYILEMVRPYNFSLEVMLKSVQVG